MRPLGVLILVAVVLGGAYLVLQPQSTRPPSRYPELEALPRADLDRARLALAPELVGPPTHENLAARRGALRLDACTPLAVVAVLHERAEKPGATEIYGPCFDDLNRRPVGTWLAAQRDASLNDVLLRLASDEELAFDLRDTAVVALGWEGNEEARPGLVRLSMDMDVGQNLRIRVFSRLARIGIPPGDPFEELLHLPFHGHDASAAAVLALSGRPVAPSLIREVLRSPDASADDREHLAARAAAAISAGDPDVAEKAGIAQLAIEASWSLGESPGVPEEQAIGDLAAAFERWLDAHPDARASPYERARRAYREGSQYAREQRVLEAESPADTPEGELDFGAAAVLVGDAERRWTDRHLDSLDRLAALFRRDLAGVTSPRDGLTVLHRRLLPRHVRFSGSIEQGPSSFLRVALSQRAGNCVGLTSLYVALGERLDLPLVAVSIPGHVYLRWDDGETRIDVELTDQGRLRTDEELDGASPRVLTKKGLVSVMLSNRGGIWLDSPRIRPENRVGDALRFADEALAYDPENEGAHLVRARCLARLGDETGALAAAERALELAPLDPGSPVVAAECLYLAGRYEKSLAWFDRARELEPDDGDVFLGRLSCLSRLGRDEDVLSDATAFLADHDHRGVRVARLRAMVDLDRDGWEAELTALATEPPAGWTLRITTAEHLLDRDAAADALRVLSSLQVLEKEARAAAGKEGNLVVTVDGDTTLVLPAETLRSWYRRVQTLKAEALEMSGRADEAGVIRERLAD